MDAVFLPRKLTPAEVVGRLEQGQLSGALTSGVPTAVDSLLVDNYREGWWQLCLTKGATQRSDRTLIIRHNGLTGSDATVIELSDSGPADTGACDVTVDADLNGAGVAQLMRVVLTAASSGWSYSLWRLPQKPPQTA